jgi:hypothetical protein
MSKILPHRLQNGRCRDCSMFDPSSAPATCTRCSLEIMGRLGYVVVEESPARLWTVRNYELWRVAGGDQVSGRLQADRFYLYVGHNDGGPLEPPPDLVSESHCQTDRIAARALAAELVKRYPQVWVVTTVGSWNAIKAH